MQLKGRITRKTSHKWEGTRYDNIVVSWLMLDRKEPVSPYEKLIADYVTCNDLTHFFPPSPVLNKSHE